LQEEQKKKLGIGFLKELEKKKKGKKEGKEFTRG